MYLIKEFILNLLTFNKIIIKSLLGYNKMQYILCIANTFDEFSLFNLCLISCE